MVQLYENSTKKDRNGHVFDRYPIAYIGHFCITVHLPKPWSTERIFSRSLVHGCGKRSYSKLLTRYLWFNYPFSIRSFVNYSYCVAGSFMTTFFAHARDVKY